MQSRPTEDSDTSSTRHTRQTPSPQTQHGYFRNEEPEQRLPSDREGRGASQLPFTSLSATTADNEVESPNAGAEPSARSVKPNPSGETVRSIDRIDQYEKAFGMAQVRKSSSPGFKIVSKDRRSSKVELTINNFPNGKNLET